MQRNEDGQFELILGNRQVLSVFFIVVILLGVFFTVGYIVGRNSAPVVTADAFPARTDSRPLVVEATPPAPSAEPPKTTPPPEPPKPVTTAQQQPAETPTPKTEPAKPEPAKPEPATAEPTKPAPPPPVQAKSGPPPAGGRIYLQLSATKQAEAETYLDVLRKRGFPALTTPVPENTTLLRVLVGPISEGEVNKVRADLQSAGFPGDKALRRQF